jgi:hypothetical protein
MVLLLRVSGNPEPYDWRVAWRISSISASLFEFHSLLPPGSLSVGISDRLQSEWVMRCSALFARGVRQNLWVAVPDAFTPRALRDRAQGCRAAATLGSCETCPESNPVGVAPPGRDLAPTSMC